MPSGNGSAKKKETKKKSPAKVAAKPGKSMLQKAGDAVIGEAKSLKAGYDKFQKSRTGFFNDYYKNLKGKG